MLRYRAKAFPHPVLSNFGDDFGPDSEFKLDLTAAMEEDTQRLSLHYSVDWSSNWLDEYILDGHAALYLDIECRTTLYRKFWALTQLTGEVEIEAGAVLGTVLVTPVVIATGDNHSYRPDGLSAEYGERTFAIGRGDVLAVGPTELVDLDFERALAKDLVLIRYSDSDEYRDVYRAVFDGDTIVINVGSNLHAAIQTMRSSKDLKPYLWATLYKDCLSGALNYLAEEEDGEETQLAWGRALIRKLHDVNRALYVDDPQEQDLSAQLLIADRGLKRVGG